MAYSVFYTTENVYSETQEWTIQKIPTILWRYNMEWYPFTD